MTPHARLPAWEHLLHSYLEAHAGAPFVWGHLDCALFGAGAVLAVTGVDPAAAFRGRYSTAVGSARALRRYGAGTLEATLDTIFPAQAIGYARRGDLVLCDGMVGVCVGADALFVGEDAGVDGLLRFARSSWSRAWAIG